MSDADRIERGLAAYSRDRAVLLRLLRKRGSFTEHEFDLWYTAREYRRPRMRMRGICGDSFLLGLGQNGGNLWAETLELLQYMMALGEVTTERRDGVIVYKLAEKPE